MQGISDFFSRIKSIYSRELVVRGAIKDSIRKHTAAELPIEAITFSANSVVLKKTNPVMRSVIFIKKRQIIKDINKAQTVKVITDIR